MYLSNIMKLSLYALYSKLSRYENKKEIQTNLLRTKKVLISYTEILKRN